MTDLKELTKEELITRYGSRRIGEHNGSYQSMIEGNEMFDELLRRLTEGEADTARLREIRETAKHFCQYSTAGGPYSIGVTDAYRHVLDVLNDCPVWTMKDVRNPPLIDAAMEATNDN